MCESPKISQAMGLIRHLCEALGNVLRAIIGLPRPANVPVRQHDRLLLESSGVIGKSRYPAYLPRSQGPIFAQAGC